MMQSTLFPIFETSQTGEARRAVVELARRLGFDLATTEKAAIIVTEAATNLIKHTRGGHLILQPLQDDDVVGLDILALDRGPGIANVNEALRNGYSTAGSSGEGLGAIQRLASHFDIHSLPNVGTAILARLYARPLPAPPRMLGGVICLPKSGEMVCGDSWSTIWQPARGLVIVADGLGHGPLAAAASRAAVERFQERASDSLIGLMEAIHAGLHSTRGAAVAVAAISYGAQVSYIGVGNISGVTTVQERTQHLVSHNGTAGHTVHRLQEFQYPWAHSGLLIMHSDGLGTRWQLSNYPGLVTRHPALIAGVLWRDFSRGTDDVTVAVFREPAV